MTLDVIFSRTPAQSIELRPNELAGAELRAVTDYTNPVFPGDVLSSAAYKAEQRVAGAYSALALNMIEAPQSVTDLVRRYPNPDDLKDATNGSDSSVKEAIELAEILRDWQEKAANVPEYTEDEALVVRTALGWRAVTARDSAERKEARAAREQYDDIAGRAPVVWAHFRYAAHIVLRKTRVALTPTL